MAHKAMKLYGMDTWKKPAPADVPMEGRNGLSWDGAAPWKGWTGWHRMGWDGMGMSYHHAGGANLVAMVMPPASKMSTFPHLYGSAFPYFYFKEKKGFFLLTLFSLPSKVTSKASSLDVPSCGDSERTQRWGAVLGSFSMGKTFHEMDVSKGRDECWHGRDGPKTCCILSVQPESPHRWLGLA